MQDFLLEVPRTGITKQGHTVIFDNYLALNIAVTNYLTLNNAIRNYLTMNICNKDVLINQHQFSILFLQFQFQAVQR